MAGLLGNFSDFIKTPEGQGLLAATFGGLAGARSGAPINSIGRAGLAGLSGYSGAIDRQQQAAEAEQMKRAREMQMELYQAQAERMKAQTAQEQAALEADKRKREAIPTLWAPKVSQGTFSVPEMGGVEMFSAGAKVDKPSMASAPTFDVQAALRAGLTAKEIAEYAGLGDIGKQEVKDWQDIEGAGGVKIRQGFDRFGQPVGTGVNGYVAPVQVNQGDRTTFAKPVAGASFSIGMSPSERDASARGWAGVRQAGERLTLDRQKFDVEKGAGASKSTEGERTAAALLQRLRSSQLQMDDALAGGKTGAEKPSLIAQGMRGLGAESLANTWNTPERQRVEAAQLDILDAALTLGTGAAYTKEQLEGYRKAYFPQIGDDATTVKDKQTRLENILSAAEIKAGVASKNVPTVEQMKAARGFDAIPQAAINHLKMNPRLRAQFDAKYGDGAATKVLGQ